MRIILALSCLLLAVSALGESFATDQKAVSRFLTDQYRDLSSDFQWIEKGPAHSDKTHVHHRYELYYKGRRVAGRTLKVHFNKKGFIDYSTANFADPFDVDVRPPDPQLISHWRKKITADLQKEWGSFKGRLQLDPVIWVNRRNGKSRAALEVFVLNNNPMKLRHFFIDEKTGEILEEQPTARFHRVDVPIFTVSPFGGAATSSVTLPELDSATKLSNAEIYVRREQDTSDPTLVDVTPMDFTGVGGFNINPSLYNHSCTGDSANCPNQGFNSVNVYYHTSKYRTRIGNYLSQLGSEVDFAFDPLNIIVNSLSGVSGSSNSNNAAYVPFPCRDEPEIDHCLIFLRPAAVAGPSVCGSGATQLYDMAREALIVTHEYQHYITDMITAIGFVETGETAVGDALHEGYSDYLAASYVSDEAGRDVTLVGEYALQNCEDLQRELSIPKVYEEGDAVTDAHTSGLTWASALWTLRTELGTATADLLVVKSLFFLSTAPGFVEAIDALIRADEALNNGVNARRIREILFDELKFVGSADYLENGIVDVGLRGCATVPYPRVSSHWLLALFFLWLSITILLGRRKSP